MRKPLLLSALLSLFLVPAAQAAVPQFQASCGGQMEVHDEDGTVFHMERIFPLLKAWRGQHLLLQHGALRVVLAEILLRDAVRLREVPTRGDPLADRQLAAVDLRTEVVCDLRVRRSRVVVAHAHRREASRLS